MRLRHWALQRERSVRPVIVVVAHELTEHRTEMSLVDHDYVIETLCADCLNEPSRDRIGLWRPRRRPHACDSEVAGSRIEVAAVDAVPVVDEMDGLATSSSRFQKLLPDPGRRRTGRDVEMDDLTALRSIGLTICDTR